MTYRGELEALRARIEQLESANRDLQWELTKSRAKTHVSNRPPSEDPAESRARIAELEKKNRTLEWDLATMTAKARITSAGSPSETPQSAGEFVFGAPSSIVEEREIPVELAQKSQEALLFALRKHFGANGVAATTPASVTWSVAHGATYQTPAQVLREALISSDDGRTRLRIIDNTSSLRLGPIFVPVVPLSLLPILVLKLGLAPAVALGLALTAGMFLALRSLVRARVSRRRHDLFVLASELEAIICRDAHAETERATRVRVSDEELEDTENPALEYQRIKAR